MVEPDPHLPVGHGGLFAHDTLAGFCSKTIVEEGMPVQVPETGYCP